MTITEAQHDVRTVYRGGFYGQLVSGAVWLGAAAVATWVSDGAAIAALWLGGVLIFPLTTLALRLSGGPAALPAGHPMAALATQIAFTVPIGLLVAVVLGAERPELFFPASMVVVGAHYLPFVFLYGMRLFAVLAAVLVAGGVALASLPGAPSSAGGWLTGAALVVFAALLRRSAAAEGGTTTDVG
ncbi:DUF7010 family protein [Georgenia muralis]